MSDMALNHSGIEGGAEAVEGVYGIKSRKGGEI